MEPFWQYEQALVSAFNAGVEVGDIVAFTDDWSLPNPLVTVGYAAEKRRPGKLGNCRVVFAPSADMLGVGEIGIVDNRELNLPVIGMKVLSLSLVQKYNLPTLRYDDVVLTDRQMDLGAALGYIVERATKA